MWSLSSRLETRDLDIYIYIYIYSLIHTQKYMYLYPCCKQKLYYFILWDVSRQQFSLPATVNMAVFLPACSMWKSIFFIWKLSGLTFYASDAVFLPGWPSHVDIYLLVSFLFSTKDWQGWREDRWCCNERYLICFLAFGEFKKAVGQLIKESILGTV